jgi:hypothetical protein
MSESVRGGAQDDKTLTRTVIVQESDGTKSVTIPADIADEINLEKGDPLLLKPDGEDGLVGQKGASVWED